MSEETTLPPVKIAFVIDGEVIEILHTDERLAAIFLSQPTIVDITERIEQVKVGSIFDGTDFNSPEAN
jgi:hypothetical protein